MNQSCGWVLFVLAAACAPGAPARSQPAVEEGEGVQAFERAREAARSGDAVRAEQYLVAALSEGYAEEEIVPQLVRLCVGSSRFRTAVRHLEPYVRRNPGAVALRQVLATLYLALGQSEAARGELTDIVRLVPDHADAHFLLGVMDARGGRDGGQDHLRRYLELAPDGEHAAEARDLLDRDRGTQPVPVAGRREG
jgi:predicted Zn-dependent protease